MKIERPNKLQAAAATKKVTAPRIPMLETGLSFRVMRAPLTFKQFEAVVPKSIYDTAAFRARLNIKPGEAVEFMSFGDMAAFIKAHEAKTGQKLRPLAEGEVMMIQRRPQVLSKLTRRTQATAFWTAEKFQSEGVNPPLKYVLRQWDIYAASTSWEETTRMDPNVRASGVTIVLVEDK